MSKGILLPLIPKKNSPQQNTTKPTYTGNTQLWHFSAMEHHFAISQPNPGQLQTAHQDLMYNKGSEAHNPGEFRFLCQRGNHEIERKGPKTQTGSQALACNMSQEALAALKDMRRDTQSQGEADKPLSASHRENHSGKSRSHVFQLPLLKQTQKTKKLKKRKRLDAMREKLPLLQCKAPFSHTAARIGRKNRGKVRELRSDSDDQEISTAVDISDMKRPFEITPAGYDCRYLATIPPSTLYQSDDGSVGMQVIKQATEKCSHWLQQQVKVNLEDPPTTLI